MIGPRYTVGETVIRGYRVAAVFDQFRGGETFCLVDPQGLCAGIASAKARAKDIAAQFNRAEAAAIKRATAE